MQGNSCVLKKKRKIFIPIMKWESPVLIFSGSHFSGSATSRCMFIIPCIIQMCFSQTLFLLDYFCGAKLVGAFLIFLLAHMCGLCLLGHGELLPSPKFPFNHFSEEISTPSIYGVKWWCLARKCAWDLRDDFWGVCGETARM